MIVRSSRASVTPSSWRASSISFRSVASSLPSETASFTFSRKASFFLSPPDQSLMPMRPPKLFAEEFDELGCGRARLPERDEAMAAQHRLLAAQHDLAVAVDREVSAVGAAIGEHELVLAPLDLAVGARGHAIRDDQVGGAVAPQHDGALVAGKGDHA